MAGSLYQSLGELKFPLAPGLVTDHGAPLDPARGRLLNLFRAALNAEFGTAQEAGGNSPWALATGALSSESQLSGTQPVESVLGQEPSVRLMQELRLKLPLLALHRSGQATHDEHTISIRRRTQPWQLHWILGELTAADQHRMDGFLVAADALVDLVIERWGHPEFESGAPQFFPGRGTLSSIRMAASRTGQAVYGGDGGPVYYSLVCELETVELVGEVAADYENLQGADYDFGVGGDEGVIPSLIQGDTDHPPR